MLKERYTEDIDVNYEVKAFVKGSKDNKEKEKKLTHMDTGDDLYRYGIGNFIFFRSENRL